MEGIAFGLVGLLAGVVVTFLVLRGRAHRDVDAALARSREAAAADTRLLEERLDLQKGATLRVEQALDATRQELRDISTRHEVANADAVRLGGENTQLTEQLRLAREEGAVSRSQAEAVRVELAEIRTRLAETERGFKEKEALFKDAGESLKQEFQLLANQIFEQHGERLQHQQTEQLGHVLSPFRQQITDFKRRVEEVYTTDAKDRASLLSEVRNLQQASERVNREAEHLARALKGNTRVQGNWGELVLERVLEDSGLRRDHEYFVQTSFRNDDGDLKRPDVVIRLPDSKDVVIDAKVSLAAYEAALAAEADEARDAAMARHVLSLRTHVRNLSAQSYDRLHGVRSLDFVLLFVPVEAAFTMAIERDPALFTEAFEKRLVIVSPTTLMMTLRIIDNVWRYEKQSRNAQEIARRAGALYDKVRIILEDMDQLDKSLGTARRSFDAAYKRLVSGNGNLVRQVEQFRELGADVKKALPKDLLESAL